MAIGVSLFIVAILIAAIWILVEFKRLRHKFFALGLIALILFTYITFSITLRGKDVNLKTVPGLIQAGELYLTWLGSVFFNLKSITAHAINLDWTDNNSTGT